MNTIFLKKSKSVLLALENKVVLAVASHDSCYKREALCLDYVL